jgi:hypothetical protein
MLAIPGAQDACAGDLYRLDMRCIVPQSAPPVHVVVNIYSGETPDPGRLEGTCQADYDGISMSGLVWDDVVCITSIMVQGEDLVISYMVNGNDHGEFAHKTLFEVLLNGNPTYLPLGTACREIIRLDHPYAGDPFGSSTFYIEDGDGGCLYDHMYCPIGEHFYWLVGEFRVPCVRPDDLTLKIYSNEDEFQAVSTASFDGIELSDVFCSYVACITDALMVDGDLLMTFDVYGYKDQESFLANTRIELEVGGEIFYLDLHTSCSGPVLVDEPYDTVPDGTLTITEACGDCVDEGATPAEQSSWGGVKVLFR